MSKQMVLAIGAGATAFAAVVGSAATLGGITSDDLGADTTLVASCDTDGVDVAYTTAIDAASGEYEVTKVTVSGIATACAGQEISVSLLDDGSTELDATTDAVPAVVAPATSAVAELALADAPSAESVRRAAVVISG